MVWTWTFRVWHLATNTPYWLAEHPPKLQCQPRMDFCWASRRCTWQSLRAELKPDRPCAKLLGLNFQENSPQALSWWHKMHQVYWRRDDNSRKQGLGLHSIWLNFGITLKPRIFKIQLDLPPQIGTPQCLVSVWSRQLEIDKSFLYQNKTNLMLARDRRKFSCMSNMTGARKSTSTALFFPSALGILQPFSCHPIVQRQVADDSMGKPRARQRRGQCLSAVAETSWVSSGYNVVIPAVHPTTNNPQETQSSNGCVHPEISK